MKNLKYKNVELQYKPDTGDMVNTEILNKRKEIFGFLYQFILGLFFFFGLPIIACEILSGVFKDTKPKFDVFFIYLATWVIYYVLLAIVYGCLKALAYCQSQKKFAYLPLTAEECKKLEITNIVEYCEFLNDFLRVTPNGKRAKENSILWNVAEMSPDLRNKVEKSTYKIFSGAFYHILFDDRTKTYYVSHVSFGLENGSSKP